MPLQTLNGQVYSSIPPARKKDFLAWEKVLEKYSPCGLENAQAWIRNYVEHHSDNIQCSTMAGAIWRDKPPLETLYEALHPLGEDTPRFFLGLVLWKVLAEHPDTWAFYRPERGNQDDDSDLPGLVYWRIDNE